MPGGAGQGKELARTYGGLYLASVYGQRAFAASVRHNTSGDTKLGPRARRRHMSDARPVMVSTSTSTCKKQRRESEEIGGDGRGPAVESAQT